MFLKDLFSAEYRKRERDGNEADVLMLSRRIGSLFVVSWGPFYRR